MDIAALIIAIIALAASAVTLPTAFQMFWGGPKLGINVADLDGPDGKRLACNIFNAPVKSRILRRLGVHREPIIISADFQICESGSNRVMLDTARASLIDIGGASGQGTPRANLVDHIPLTFICLIHTNDGKVIAADPQKMTSVLLPPGRYRINVSVRCGDRIFSNCRREITVGERPIDTYWLPLGDD
jgi:hypothetical protein